MNDDSSIRTPLGHARGLGSAREGAHHWWMQRLSAIALVPLSLYWLNCPACVTTDNYAEFMAWLSSPAVAITMALFVLASFYHAALGLQVIIEDYAVSEGWKITLLVLNNLFFFALGIACLFAIVHISLSHPV